MGVAKTSVVGRWIGLLLLVIVQFACSRERADGITDPASSGGHGSMGVATGGTGAEAGHAGAVTTGGTGPGPGGTSPELGGTRRELGGTGAGADETGLEPAGADAGVGVAGGLGTEPGASGGAEPPEHETATQDFVDPGMGPWELVPRDQVFDACRLDIGALEQAEVALPTPWAIVRYGKLCYEHNATDFVPAEAWSTTKTLGALVTGIAAYETRDLLRTGPMTGPFGDEDRVEHWIDSFTYNPEAHVVHVLAMVAHNADLAYGKKVFAYDAVGAVQINTLSEMLNTAISQDPARLGADLEEFTRRFLFEPLGMSASSWTGGAPDKTFAFSWTTDVFDMLRLGLLMLNRGEWNGRRVLDEEWIYKMSHPSFEDANTGFGYLTWLNASSNHHLGDGLKKQEASNPGPCAPVALWKEYPHGLSEAQGCNYEPPQRCQQTYDVGVYQATGLFGQLIQVHPGLDMVIVARDADVVGLGANGPAIVWDALREAVIAADPVHQGDEEEFCQAYGEGEYAPDLR